MDLVYLAVLILFAGVIAAMATGCARLAKSRTQRGGQS